MSVIKNKLVLDTSVLLNFLKVNKEELLLSHPNLSLLVTDHAYDEVREPAQSERLEGLISSNAIELASLTYEELETYSKLRDIQVLGKGECGAMTVAASRGHVLALDDRRASREAKKQFPKIKVITTTDIMVDLIHLGIITVDTADEIKIEWENNHSFQLKFNSFADWMKIKKC